MSLLSPGWLRAFNFICIVELQKNQKQKSASLAVRIFSLKVLHVRVIDKQLKASTYSEQKKKKIQSTILQAQFDGMGALACLSTFLLCWLCVG